MTDSSGPARFENRLDPSVLALAQKLITLMRTPDDRLKIYRELALQQGDTLDLKHLHRLRDVLDALGHGLEQPHDAAFWQRVEQAWSVLCAGQHLPSTGNDHASISGGDHAANISPAYAADDLRPPERVADAAGQVAHAAQLQAASPPSITEVLPDGVTDDFRQGMARKKIKTNPPHIPGAASADARPLLDQVVPPGPSPLLPGPGQAMTEDMDDLTREQARAAQRAMAWQVTRFAELGAALERQAAGGVPTIDEIVTRFGLANENILRHVLATWRQRLDSDPELYAQYQTLIGQYRLARE